jgi:hypothetical protein
LIFLKGIVKANNTPAMVACMPECKKQYHNAIPNIK